MSNEQTSPLVGNIFFEGPEGFKEHFQYTAKDAAEFVSSRKALLDALKSIGAKPEVKKQPYAPKAGQPSPMAQAAGAVFGACPQCGGALRSRNRRDGTGSFVGCSNFPDCRYIQK